MSYFVTISDVRAAYRGIKRAKIDQSKMDDFEATHEQNHIDDDDWSCTEARNRIESTMALTSELTSPFEKAGYIKIVNQRNARVAKENAKYRVPVELDGDESAEEIVEVIRKAVQTAQDFNRVVSETEKTKKGSK